MSWEALIPYAARLGNTEFAMWLGQATWRIAGLLTVHLFGLTLLLGSIVVSSLQLLGVLERYPSRETRHDVTRVTIAGIAIIVASGSLIFTGGAEAYYVGYWFRLKMCLLAAALLFHFTVHRTVLNDSGRFSMVTRRLTGVASLLLWFSVACAGRAIAFF
jgi:hypothetical protein